MLDKEFSKLRKQALGAIQLQRAKKQVAGQLAISLESRLSEMLGVAKSKLHDNRVKTIDEVMHEVESITASDILEVANEVFQNDQMSTLIYKAKEE